MQYLDDPTYKNFKKKLTAAVQNNDLDKAKKELIEEIRLLKIKFVPDFSDINRREYYKNNIEPIYRNDLLNIPQGNSTIDIAFKNQNLAILYLLFNYLGSGYDQYLEFLKNNPIKPSEDWAYQQLKSKLIQAIQENKPSTFQQLLKMDNLRDKYVFPELINSLGQSNEAGYITQFYNKDIKLKYLDNLISELIPIVLEKRNLAILYILLSALALESREHENASESFLTQNTFIAALIQLKNQAIDDKLDEIIIQAITEARTPGHLGDLIMVLRRSGINASRLENNITIAFAYSPESEKELTPKINKLHEINAISDSFSKNYEEYKAFLNTLDTLRSDDYAAILHAINELDPNVINKKDFVGDTLLINAIQLDPSNLPQIMEELVIGKQANVNQAGEEGLTPLMNAIKVKLDDNIKIQIIVQLLNNGADLEAKDIFGKTAIDHARKIGNNKIINLLEQSRKSVVKISIQEQIIALNNLNSTLNSLANK